MLVLGIETSCDETAASVVADGTRVLSNVIASTSASFSRTGGVIPEEAARRQLEFVVPTVEQALKNAGVTTHDIDAIGVTRGPGLMGSLLVGTTTARAYASLWKKPLIGVHHTLGHLSSVWLDTPADNPPVFPCLTLSASGGHTELWYRTSHTQGTLLGRTRDDAAGEAFDKGATLLGLPYPGGPSISHTAKDGNPKAFPFPSPLKGDDTLDFSFSGLKTALRYTLRDLPDGSLPASLPDLAASYEYALCRHLIDRLEHAIEKHDDVREVHVVGGVSANARLRTMVTELCRGQVVRFPVKMAYCTDNAAMIASAAFQAHVERGPAAVQPFTTVASLPLADALAY